VILLVHSDTVERELHDYLSNDDMPKLMQLLLALNSLCCAEIAESAPEIFWVRFGWICE